MKIEEVILPAITDHRGSLTFAETDSDLHFQAIGDVEILRGTTLPSRPAEVMKLLSLPGSSLSFAVSENKHPVIGDDQSCSYTVNDCRLIQFGEEDNIVPHSVVPFIARRLFYIYDVPAQAERGGHAHEYCHEVLIAASGSFVVELDDSETRKIVLLSSPSQMLYIPPGIWAVERHYSSGTVCLVLASHPYSRHGYMDNYPDFLKYKADGN